MSDGFRFRVDADRLVARLRILRERWTGDGLRRVGEFAAAEVLKDSTQSFRRQADPTTGKAWAPSKRARSAFAAASTQHAAGKRKTAPRRNTTLLDSRRLFRSVTSDYEIKGSGRLSVVGGTRPLRYAAIHQFGGTPKLAPGPRAIPARPYVGLSAARSRRIVHFARRVLSEGRHA
ncbi:MAG: phage virion morphogenesis protein [Acidobacteriota bacterium]